MPANSKNSVPTSTLDPSVVATRKTDTFYCLCPFQKRIDVDIPLTGPSGCSGVRCLTPFVTRECTDGLNYGCARSSHKRKTVEHGSMSVTCIWRHPYNEQLRYIELLLWIIFPLTTPRFLSSSSRPLTAPHQKTDQSNACTRLGQFGIVRYGPIPLSLFSASLKIQCPPSLRRCPQSARNTWLNFF